MRTADLLRNLTEPDPRPTEFGCTACGLCCRRKQFISLSVKEALAWAASGGGLAIAVHADVADVLDACPPGISPAYRDWVRARSFDGRSGDVRLYMTGALYAKNDGACHHLDGDRCSIYEDRPLTCRVYPAQVVNPPDDQFPLPGDALCPSGAWRGNPFQQTTKLLDEQARAAVLAFQEAAIADQQIIAEVAARNLDGIATLKDEGVPSFGIPTAQIVKDIGFASRLRRPIKARQWRIMTTRPGRIEELKAMGMKVANVRWRAA